MIGDLIRGISLLLISVMSGVFGLIWLCGEHSSIWVTVGVKLFAIFLLFISYVTYCQLRKEMIRMDQKDSENRTNK